MGEPVVDVDLSAIAEAASVVVERGDERRDVDDAAVGFFIDDDIGPLLGGEIVESGSKRGAAGGRGCAASRSGRRRRCFDGSQQRRPSGFLSDRVAIGGSLVIGGGGEGAGECGEEAEGRCTIHGEKNTKNLRI